MEIHGESDIGEVEALSWIDQKDDKQRGISESSFDNIVGAEFRALVEEYYAAGATKVSALDVVDHGDWEDGNCLRIELPVDPSMRKKIFAIQNRVNREMETCFDPDAHTGQSYTMNGW